MNKVLTNTSSEDVKTTLTKQTTPIVFLTQLPESVSLRVVYTNTTVGKINASRWEIVEYSGTPDTPTAIMIAPDNIFRAVKVRVPPLARLTSDREWASGNEIK